MLKDKFGERFEREACHLCRTFATFYDVGPDYLVMELIDEALLKGPLSEQGDRIRGPDSG
jgi:hypothetical protein